MTSRSTATFGNLRLFRGTSIVALSDQWNSDPAARHLTRQPEVFVLCRSADAHAARSGRGDQAEEADEHGEQAERDDAQQAQPHRPRRADEPVCERQVGEHPREDEEHTGEEHKGRAVGT